ncbi:MAG TPA: hypothetical protein VGV90_00425, partial [Solirubrobacteraceae bacterium]|nr:hypothetical protein [Solirubrobacteraceae bacterium]
EPSMADLHDALTRMAGETRWPPTPALAEAVRAKIEAQPEVGRRRGARRPLLAALLALVVGGGVLASPGVGSDLLERLGLRNATVQRVERLPPTALGGSLRLGRRHSLASARRVAGFPLLRPAALGPPREVYVDDGVVSFVYRARSGRPMLFTQVPGRAGRYVQKFVTEDTRRVRVAGAPALLLSGPHAVFFDARGGGTRVQEARLAKNTLMWERNGLLLRLEAEQPVGELIRIARSVRAG